jgi:hypothetical protein
MIIPLFPSEGAIQDTQHNIQLKCLATYSFFYEIIFKLYVKISFNLHSYLHFTKHTHYVRNVSNNTFTCTEYSWSFVYCVITCVCFLVYSCILFYYVCITLVAGCWLEVSIRKVLQPATSAQNFLGFPVSISECWDGSQDSKLLLHASHVALPT